MATPIKKGVKTDFLNKASGDFMRMYLLPSTVYASWAEANPYGQLLIMGKDGNVAQTAGQSFDMGLQDGEAYGIAAVGFYGDDDGDDLGSQWARLVEAQVTLTVSQTGNTTLMALRGCVCLVADVLPTPDAFTSGVEGQIELLGDCVMTADSADAVGMSAGRFIVSCAGNVTVRREFVLSGVRAELAVTNGKSITQTGSSGSLVEGASAAFVAVCKTGTRGDLWDDALYIDGANNALGFRAVDDNYSCGIKAETSTPSGAKTHSIRINAAGTAGYIMVYAAEGG